MKNFGIKLDSALDYLRKDVKVSTSKKYDVKESERKLRDYIVREYNEDGIKTLSTYYNHSGELSYYTIERFNHLGYKIGYTTYDSKDLKTSSSKYELDAFGRIEKKYFDDYIEKKYKYDDDGNILEALNPDTGAREIYEYDENGFAISELNKNDGDGELNFIFSPTPKLLRTFINDKWGNVIEMSIYDGETNELLFTEHSIINSSGDEIERIEYNKEGSIILNRKYQYKYDYKENWIYMETLDKEGIIISIEEREITYYSSDTNKIEQEDSETSTEIWRSRKLDGGQLAMLAKAFMKSLFPTPKEGQILVQEDLADHCCVLYFEENYFITLTSTIRDIENSGEFARSNAEDEWNDLMYSIEFAKQFKNLDYKSLRPYVLFGNNK